MSDKYTLIVVDVQPIFTSDATVIANVAREVRTAREKGNPVIFLWIPYHSPLQEEAYARTFPQILREVDGWSRDFWAEAEKVYTEDGSYHVISTCDWKHFAKTDFRVCGVNTNYCVRETVKGLLEKPGVLSVEVVKDACGTSDRWIDKTKVWDLFPDDARLKLS